MSLLDRPAPDPAFDGMIETMKEQQKTLTEMAMSMRNSPPVPSQPIVIYTQPQVDPPKDPIQTQYDTVRRNNREYQRLLEEFDPTKDVTPTLSRAPSSHRSYRKHITRSNASPEPPPDPPLSQEEKETVVKDMSAAIEIFTEVATTWALKAIRAPLTSVINEPELDLNILTKAQSLRQGQGRPDQINTKVLKIQVRIKGILEGIREEIPNLPTQLRVFLQQMTSNGVLIPHSYLTGFERSRLDFDAHGAVRNFSKDNQKMLICMFFLTRIIVSRLLLNGYKHGLPFNPNSTTAINLKILASILELLTLTSFVRLNRSQSDGITAENEVKNRAKGVRLAYNNDDGLWELYTMGEMIQAYRAMGGWIDNMKELMKIWAEEMWKNVHLSRFRLE